MLRQIFLAIVAGTALSAPAWADDPVEVPTDTRTRAIVLDPAEAPIDTEMKIILWLENIEALRAHIADGGKTVRSGVGPRATGRTGPAIAEYR
jgi:hypothetical protein